MKVVAVVAAAALAALVAVFVWPTRYRYEQATHGQSSVLLRIDRFSGQTQMFHPTAGWVRRGAPKAAPTAAPAVAPAAPQEAAPAAAPAQPQWAAEITPMGDERAAVTATGLRLMEFEGRTYAVATIENRSAWVVEDIGVRVFYPFATHGGPPPLGKIVYLAPESPRQPLQPNGKGFFAALVADWPRSDGGQPLAPAAEPRYEYANGRRPVQVETVAERRPGYFDDLMPATAK